MQFLFIFGSLGITTFLKKEKHSLGASLDKNEHTKAFTFRTSMKFQPNELLKQLFLHRWPAPQVEGKSS